MFLFSSLKSPSSLCLSSYKQWSCHIIISMLLLWTLSSSSVSLLYWRAQKWTQHTRCGLTSAEGRERISFFDLLATLHLLMPRILLATFASRTHYWLTLYLVSTRTPRPFSVKPAGRRPARTGARPSDHRTTPSSSLQSPSSSRYHLPPLGFCSQLDVPPPHCSQPLSSAHVSAVCGCSAAPFLSILKLLIILPSSPTPGLRLLSSIHLSLIPPPFLTFPTGKTKAGSRLQLSKICLDVFRGKKKSSCLGKKR